MCTERKATGLFVLTSFLCDNAQKAFTVEAMTHRGAEFDMGSYCC